MAVGQDDGLGVHRHRRLDPGHGGLEPRGRHALAGVVQTVMQVGDLRSAPLEQPLVRPLDPGVHDVRDAELAEFRELEQGEGVITGAEVSADRELRRDEVDVGEVGDRDGAVHGSS